MIFLGKDAFDECVNLEPVTVKSRSEEMRKKLESLGVSVAFDEKAQ